MYLSIGLCTLYKFIHSYSVHLLSYVYVTVHISILCRAARIRIGTKGINIAVVWSPCPPFSILGYLQISVPFGRVVELLLHKCFCASGINAVTGVREGKNDCCFSPASSLYLSSLPDAVSRNLQANDNSISKARCGQGVHTYARSSVALRPSSPIERV